MIKNIYTFAKDLVNAYIEDDGFTKGAALAYYTTFSIAPIIFIIIAIAGVFFGQAAVKGEVFVQLEGMLGAETAATVQEVVEASYKAGENFWVALLGIGTLIFGATGAFTQLKLSLDKIWQIESKPVNGIIGFLKARMISFAMVIGLGFVLLVSLVVDALAAGIGNQIAMRMGEFGEGGLAALTSIISIGLSIVIFAAIFKFLPDAKVRWKEVLWGSLFTAILFAIGRTAIGHYIGNSSITTGFGAAGSLVALLVWTYYSSQTVFLGAEFIWVLSKRNNHPVLPGKQAVLVLKRTRKVNHVHAENEIDDGVDGLPLAEPIQRVETDGEEFTHQSITRKRKEKKA